MRRAVEHELRPERADQQLRRRRARGLGRASVGLESRRLASSSRSARDRRSTSRTPGAGIDGFFVADNLCAAAVGLDAVQHRGSRRSSVARRRRLRRLGPLRRRARRSPGQVDNLVADSSGYGAWSQYFNGVDVTANVRAAGASCSLADTSTGQTVADNCDVRAHLPELATTTTGTSAFGAGLERLRRDAREPVLPRRVRRPHAAPRPLVLHRAEGRRPAVGDVPEQARRDAGGQLRGRRTRPSHRRSGEISRAMRANVTVNLVAPGDDVRRSDQRARPPRGKEPEVRPTRGRCSRWTSTTR